MCGGHLILCPQSSKSLGNMSPCPTWICAHGINHFKLTRVVKQRRPNSSFILQIIVWSLFLLIKYHCNRMTSVYCNNLLWFMKNKSCGMLKNKSADWSNAFWLLVQNKCLWLIIQITSQFITRDHSLHTHRHTRTHTDTHTNQPTICKLLHF